MMLNYFSENSRNSLAVGLGLLLAGAAHAATLAPGYTIGSLTPAFLDNAATGGGDSGTAGDLGFVVELTGMPKGWQVGDTVSITGVALPIRPTTSAGTMTFNFFDLDQGANPNAFEGDATETLVGSAQVNVPDVTSASTFWVVFDTPVVFTAHSTGIAVQFTNTASMRVKINTAGTAPGAVRKSTVDGTPSGGTNPNMRFTLAGSVLVPPPVGSLTWQGDLSGDWDAATTNWNLHLGSYSFAPASYTDDGSSGPAVIFNDTLNSSFLRTNITLTTGTPLRPASVRFENSAYNYNLGGPGKITGATVLSNVGPGVVTLATANDFFGGSFLTGGRVRLANAAGLGWGSISFAGGGLSSDSATPRTVTNDVVLLGTAVLGHPVDNGRLTIPGLLDFGGAGRTLDVQSDVVVSGSLTNGGIESKSGPGALTLSGQDAETLGTWAIRDGALKVDGISVTRSSGSSQVGAAANNGVARLVITNGATVTIGTATALRLGVQGQSSLTSSNYLDLAGTLQFDTNVSAVVQLGQACAYAELNMFPGSLLRAGGVTHATAAGNSTIVNINGGTIVASANNADFMTNHTAVYIRSGGVVFDTEDYNITVGQDLLDGGGGGGLTKRGNGVLGFAGANPVGTYTGATVVQAGTLAVATVPFSSYPPSSPLVISNGAAVTLGVGGGYSTMQAPSVSLNGSTLRMDYGTLFANPGVAAVDSATQTGTLLTVNGANLIEITGTGFAAGQFPLIKYSGRSGSGSFQLKLPLGVFGSLVTNTTATPNSIDLNITSTVNTLTWWGGNGADWNTTTLNWNTGSSRYQDYGTVGDAVVFDDTLYNDFVNPPPTNVNLTTALRPAMIVVNNFGYDYRFTGAGKVTGPTSLLKDGFMGLTLGTANDFTGGSAISNGVVRLGNNTGLGLGPITFGGGGLSSDGAAARTVANAATIASEVTFGDAIQNGKLTFTGDLGLAGGSRNVTTFTDTEFSGTYSNGGFVTKLGTGNLIFSGTGEQTSGNWQIGEGDIIVNGGSVHRTSGGVRLACQLPGGVSRVVVTNGGRLDLIASSANLRVGSGADFIGAVDATNILNVAGTLNVGGAIQLGASCAFAQINLFPGSLVRASSIVPIGNTTELNLNGGTLSPQANSATFLQGLTNAYVRSGGMTVDTAGFDITIAQDLLAGGGAGGLTKLGAGALYLNGANTYAGLTTVGAGALGGTGIISGPVTVAAAGTLSPGTSLGTLTINNHLTNSGTVFMELDFLGGTTPVADQVLGLNNVTYGGNLVVSNLSATPLEIGQVFQLFSASGLKTGQFAQITVLGAGAAGLGGTFDPATGELTLTTAAGSQPYISQVTISDGNLILQGTNGTASGSYSILTSTDVAAPLANWTTNTTGFFGAGGAFSNAIPVGSDPARFFQIKTP